MARHTMISSKHTHHLLLLLSGLLLLSSCGSRPRSESTTTRGQLSTYAVAFYNVENLFDYEDDPANSGDDDFLPTGSYHWTEKQYVRKLDNIARVISQLARPTAPYGPALIGVAEVENRRVLEDLTARPTIKEMGLEVIHYDSPDRRGIDVALLYNPRLFKVTNHRTYRYPTLEHNPSFTTRDQLLVSGTLAGEELHVIVGHWPSRYGGKTSDYLRDNAAAVARHISDSLYAINPNAKILIMGDFNDDPSNHSVVSVLGAKRNIADVRPQGFFNPAWRLLDKGIGSLGYKEHWNFFDQIILSHPLLDEEHHEQLSYWKMEVFSRPYLFTKEGKRAGYPLRTFQDNTFIDGYSDHLPTIVYLVKRR